MILQPDIARFPWGETIRSELHVGQVLIDGIEVLLVEEATTRGERHRHLASRSFASLRLVLWLNMAIAGKSRRTYGKKPIGKGEKMWGNPDFWKVFFLAGKIIDLWWIFRAKNG